MKLNKYIVILSVVVVALIVYIIAFTGNPIIKDEYVTEKRQIDSLSTQIAKLQSEHIKLDSTIAVYKDSLSIKDHEIDSTNRKLKEERKYYGNKIKDINKYTPTELDSFFSDRYNK